MRHLCDLASIEIALLSRRVLGAAGFSALIAKTGSAQ
jgi:hypothetical protein